MTRRNYDTYILLNYVFVMHLPVDGERDSLKHRYYKEASWGITVAIYYVYFIDL